MIKKLLNIYFLIPITLLGQIDPLLDNDFLGQQKWVDSIYKQLTLDEKISIIYANGIY